MNSDSTTHSEYWIVSLNSLGKLSNIKNEENNLSNIMSIVNINDMMHTKWIRMFKCSINIRLISNSSRNSDSSSS